MKRQMTANPLQTRLAAMQAAGEGGGEAPSAATIAICKCCTITACSIIPLAISLSMFLTGLVMLGQVGAYNDQFSVATAVDPYDQCNGLLPTNLAALTEEDPLAAL